MIMEEALAPFDILNAHPPGAVPRGKRDSGCDTDDYSASVDQAYRPAGRPPSQEDVRSHYRALALRQGWRVAVSEESSEGECVVWQHEIDITTHLTGRRLLGTIPAAHSADTSWSRVE
jgi:hypothetical protein